MDILLIAMLLMFAPDSLAWLLPLAVAPVCLWCLWGMMKHAGLLRWHPPGPR